MTEFISDHSYLMANLAYLAATAAGLALVSPFHRRTAFLGGLVNIPCFPFMVFLEGWYWSPGRLGGWPIGIEDLLCSFSVGAMAWLAAGIPFRFAADPPPTLREAVERFLPLCGLAVLVFLLLERFGARPMSALIASNLVVWAVMLLLRRDLWIVGLVGMSAYGALHFLVMTAIFLAWPGFLRQWNLGGFWGRPILGILPVGEFAWALAYGGFWPTLIAFSLDIRPHRISPWRDAPDRSPKTIFASPPGIHRGAEVAHEP